MNIPAAQIEEAWVLIEAAHPDCTIAVTVGLWKNYSHTDATPRYRIVHDVTIFEPLSIVEHLRREPRCDAICFKNIDDLLQWAKDGAKIEEVANA